MVKVNKDTVMVKVEGFAEALYSGATAYGSILVPKSVLDLEELKNVDFCVYELDGKHSETYGEITITEGTLEELVKKEEKGYEINKYFDKVLEEVFMVEGVKDVDYKSVRELNTLIDSIYEKVEKSVELIEDLVVGDITVPKGTVINQTVMGLEKLDEFEFELKLN